MYVSIANCKVRTLDDSLRIFQDRDLKSPVFGHFPEGVEIQLGALSEIEGREWVEASLPDGTAGYLVSASARSHTEVATRSEGPLHGDGRLDFGSKPVDVSPGHTTVSFSSSTGEAASAMLSAFGCAILIVTAAWSHARVYSWLCRSLRFSDGTTAGFTGNPKRIWFPAMFVVLIPGADKWITRIIVTHTADGAARTALIWTFLLCLWFSYTVLDLKIWRWAVGGISLSSGTVLGFDGGIVACFGIVCASYVVGALIWPTYGLILLVFPPLAYWYIRWWIGHIHSEKKRLRFVGSLAQTSWRILTTMIFSILIITIPSALVWFYNWVTDNIRIESEGVMKSTR